jgi:hypothetical protein
MAQNASGMQGISARPMTVHSSRYLPQALAIPPTSFTSRQLPQHPLYFNITASFTQNALGQWSIQQLRITLYKLQKKMRVSILRVHAASPPSKCESVSTKGKLTVYAVIPHADRNGN